MDLEEPIKFLCRYLVTALNEKFFYELNSCIYQVNKNLVILILNAIRMRLMIFSLLFYKKCHVRIFGMEDLGQRVIILLAFRTMYLMIEKILSNH